MEVEGMVAVPPRYNTLLVGCRLSVGLALDAQVHNMVTTDSTVVDHNI